MGYGDFKLLAAVGALLGWKMLPLVILLSSVVGARVRRAADVRRARPLGRRLPLPLRALPRRSPASIAMFWGERDRALVSVQRV